MSGCHFGVTFDCGSAQMFLLLHLIDISITKLYGLLHLIIKRPARDACLCMGELPAPPAPPAPAAPPAPPAPHFVFLITL